MTDDRYDYFTALFYCFFSKPFYRHVYRRWNHAGMLYVAFVIAIALLPIFVGIQIRVSKVFSEIIVPIAEQIPRLTLNNGKLSFEGESPYPIKSQKMDDILIIFDKTDQEVSPKNMLARVMVMPTKLALREDSGAVRLLNFPDNLQFVLTPDMMLYWVRQNERWLVYFLVPFVWFFVWFFVLLFIAAYAAVFKGLTFFTKMAAPYKSLYRLTAVAFTPVILIHGIVSIWRPGGLPDWLGYLFPFLFVSLGLWYNRDISEEPTAAL